MNGHNIFFINKFDAAIVKNFDDSANSANITRSNRII